jgi:hypothetical protein
VEGPDGYYDGVHMTTLNNNHLIDAAADIIHQAYAYAMQARQTSVRNVP